VINALWYKLQPTKISNAINDFGTFRLLILRNSSWTVASSCVFPDNKFILLIKIPNTPLQVHYRLILRMRFTSRTKQVNTGLLIMMHRPSSFY